MPSVNRLWSFVVVYSLAFLAACGGGGSHITPTPPPSGGFGLSSLKGTYVFSTAGFDVTGNFLSIAGTFSANGSGGITGGTMTVSGPSIGGSASNQPIGNNSSYILTSDGRGQAQLKNSTTLGTITLDFVLSSPSHGLVSEFDTNGTGSGTLDLQSSATLSTSYAFNLSGTDLSGNPFATVGSITLASGTVSTGVQDFNDANAFSSQTITGGSVSTGSSGAPGVATFTTAGPLGTLSFDVYPIDGTDLKLVETDSKAFLSGDAFTQQGAALPTSKTTLVFTMSGSIGSTFVPVAVGGFMPVDGVSAISGGTLDLNNNGSALLGQSFSGSYTASGSGGRTLFNLSSFSVATQFVGYPTASAGLQLLESDSTGLLGGVAFAQQSGATLAASQGYALGLSATNLSANAEEEDIAEFSTTSGAFSGLIDIDDVSSAGVNPVTDQKYSGTFTLDSPATGRGEFTSTQYNSGIFYALDGSTLLFLDVGDNIGLVGTGVLALQNASANPALLSQHSLVLPRPLPHGNRKQQRSK
jgi:hypothetical protein